MGSRKPFLLRISPELWDELESWAREEMRSVNGQIEYLLRQCVVKRKGTRAIGGQTPPEADQASSGGSDPSQT